MNQYNLGIAIYGNAISYALCSEDTIYKTGVHIIQHNVDQKFVHENVRRREYRLRMKYNRRKQARLKKVRYLLNQIFPNIGKPVLNLLQVRTKALKEKISPREYYYTLYYFQKMRGYSPLYRNKEKEEIDTYASTVVKEYSQSGLNTIGQWLEIKYKNEKKIRNRHLIDKTALVIPRKLLLEEIKKIYQSQQAHYPQFTQSIYDEYILLFQESKGFAKNIKNKVGFCTFLSNEKRAPKFSPCAEYFIYLSKINHLRIIKDGNEFKLTEEQRVICLSLKNKLSEINLSQIRKALSLDDSYEFNLMKLDKEENRIILGSFKGRKAIQSALKTSEDEPKHDVIAEILSFTLNDSDRINELKKLDLNDKEIQELLEISFFKGTINLSLKFLYIIIPSMEKGLNYYDAVKLAGYDSVNPKKKEKKEWINALEQTRNPIVDRTSATARKLINQIIQRYGHPQKIKISIYKNTPFTAEQKKTIKQRINKYEKGKIYAVEKFYEKFGFTPNATDLMKYRLYNAQKGHCLITGIQIKEAELFDHTKWVVEHIIPFTKCFNNSFGNLFLCPKFLADKRKDNLLCEVISQEEYLVILERMQENKIPKIMINSFQKKEVDIEQSFTKIVTTNQYIANHIKDALTSTLINKKGYTIPAMTVSWRAIEFLKKSWKIYDTPDREIYEDPKFRSDPYQVLKHNVKAINAIMLCFVSFKNINQIAKHFKYNQAGNPDISLPYPSFKEEIFEQINHIFCTQSPICRVRGSLHDDTIRSLRGVEGKNKSLIKRIEPTTWVSLSKLTLKNLDELTDKEGHNKGLFLEIQKRLVNEEKINTIEYKGKVIFKVQISNTDQTTILKIDERAYEHATHARLDVYKNINDKKYYLVPQRKINLLNGVLFNRVISSTKPIQEWEELNDDYQFQFSLWPNSLFYYKQKKQDKGYYAYYNSVNCAGGSICFHFHNDKELLSVGVKNLQIFERKEINYFGEIREYKPYTWEKS